MLSAFKIIGLDWKKFDYDKPNLISQVSNENNLVKKNDLSSFAVYTKTLFK